MMSMMNIAIYSEIKEKLKSEEYGFLRTDPHLGNNIILLGLGGSYAYGTYVEGSDIDIRGVALNSKREILSGRPFEQVIDNKTDTVIYSFSKIMHLLSNANPNVLELLFLEPWQYMLITPIGQQLLDRREMFLSKQVVYTFGGYARSQLNKLENKSRTDTDEEMRILRSIEKAKMSYPDRFFEHESDQIDLYIDDAVHEEMVSEIFMDVSLKHYPLRDYKEMWNDMQNIVRQYGKIGKRARSAINRNAVDKHAAHLVRLLLQAIEILETGTFHTFCEKDHDLLMDIRSGKYAGADGQLSNEFFDMVDDLEKKMNKAAEVTSLPDKPDLKKIEDFLVEINEHVVR